tara:strand:- start:9 stop:371 length:363 start_codon:yes stop_codon:yes gene_type:complete
VNHKLFGAIVELVSDMTHLKETEIFQKSRKKAYVDARYLIMYIARQLDIKPVYIQRFFILKGFELHYTTLFHASNRIEEDMKEDEYMKEMVDTILLQFDPTRVIKKYPNKEYINQGCYLK